VDAGCEVASRSLWTSPAAVEINVTSSHQPNHLNEPSIKFAAYYSLLFALDSSTPLGSDSSSIPPVHAPSHLRQVPVVLTITRHHSHLHGDELPDWCSRLTPLPSRTRLNHICSPLTSCLHRRHRLCGPASRCSLPSSNSLNIQRPPSSVPRPPTSTHP
jgi:hypothetical protein